MISIYYSPKYERTVLVYCSRPGFLTVETMTESFEFSRMELETLLLEECYYLVGYL